MRKLPPLNAVRAFEAAARHVNFTKAAEELHVTHGAVSRQVALLEEWLGTPLFVRSPSQLSITSAGSAFLAEVMPALDRIANAASALKERPAPSALHVNAPPTFAMRWLISRLSGFRRRHPDVEVKLTTALSPVNFKENGYDVAIRGLAEPLAGCVSVPFMSEINVPVCHRDLMESGGLAVPQDLARHTLISYNTELFRWTQWLEKAGVGDLKPASTLQFEQMYFALQAAAEGLGVVLVPLFLVVDDIIAGKLCAPFGTLAALQRAYYANLSPTSTRQPMVDSFCKWLVHEGGDTEASLANWANAMGWHAEVKFPGGAVT